VAEATTPRHGRGPGGERRGAATQPTGGTTATPDDGARLEAWVDELRADTASALRRREQWLRRQAADDATVAGVLVGHAERGSTLAVTTRSGNRHVGRVRGAGSDLVLMDVTGARVAIDVGSIDTIRAIAGEHERPVDPMGHRSGADATSMAEVLALVVVDRPDVTLVTRAGEHLSGELVAVGRDVVMVQPPERGPLVYAPVASLSEALLPASTGSG
jgi:hypothetical protein